MSKLRDMGRAVLARISGTTPAPSEVSDLVRAIPSASPKEREEVGAFIDQIYEDGVKYFQDRFMRSRDSRFYAWSTPKAFWDACLRLEGGDHWYVWGSRLSEEKDWKQELVDDVVGDQIRARAAFLTGSWHDVEIAPNVAHINDILDHERKATDWSSRTRRTAKYMSVFGSAIQRSIFDKSENRNGYATEILCRPGSVARTPYATSFREMDGCWYVVHLELVNQSWIRKYAPDFPLDEVTPSGKFSPISLSPNTNQTDREYDWTKLYVKKEAYFDDRRTVSIPFEQEEFDQRIALLIQGEPVEPALEDNHVEWIKAYQAFVEERVNTIERAEAEEPITDAEVLKEVQAIFNLVDQQIEQHKELMDTYESRTGLKPGRELKYPYGRYVMTIESKVVVDMANPYEMDWRRLFVEIKNEDVPERVDGRSDVEILWNRNKIIDIALSRFADNALLNAYQKPWVTEQDFEAMKRHGGWSNDPTVPGIYVQSPPVYPRTNTVGAELYLQMYGTIKQTVDRALGVNDVTYGQAPSKQPSAELAQTLLQQNEILITGEANQNLADSIEQIVETRIEMWRKFYTFPRIYTIDGQQRLLIVADVLNQQPVIMPDGSTSMLPVTEFQVRVRPGSNFPNKWEKDLQLFLMLAQTVDATTGMPLVPGEMILDLLGQRFPSLARGGQYRQINQALQIGMAVMQQQAQQQQVAREPLEKIADRVANQEVNSFVKSLNGNGESK